MGTSKFPRRVVVTGLGALSPIGHTVTQTWESVCNGVSGGDLIQRFDASEFTVRIACELKGFDLRDHFTVKEINRMDRISLYALVVAREAWKDARLDAAQAFDPVRAGIIWASGNGGIESLEEGLLGTDPARPRFSPYLIPKTLIDTPSGMIAMAYGLRGINYCPVAACASSTVACMDAFNYIRWNKADLILAGGSDAPISRTNIGGFAAMKALSTKNDTPSLASTPLDADRDGFVMGEGAGMLVFEELEHALKRNAPIYAEVAGAGMSNDAYHATSTHPDGEGARLAISQALDEAGISAADIDYVNLHATGTPAGDMGELKALASLIPEEKRSGVKISATKGSTGHLLGAAGALEGVFTVQAIREGKIPPTINTHHPDKALPEGFSYVWHKPVHDPDIRYALNNNFGFGGHNAVVLFRKFDRKA